MFTIIGDYLLTTLILLGVIVVCNVSVEYMQLVTCTWLAVIITASLFEEKHPWYGNCHEMLALKIGLLYASIQLFVPINRMNDVLNFRDTSSWVLMSSILAAIGTYYLYKFLSRYR